MRLYERKYQSLFANKCPIVTLLVTTINRFFKKIVNIMKNITISALVEQKSLFLSQYIQKFINETWLERYGSVLPQETLTLLWSFIVSVYCIGGMMGCLCSGYLTAKFGK